jgi:hypothetical protein
MLGRFWTRLSFCRLRGAVLTCEKGIDIFDAVRV